MITPFPPSRGIVAGDLVSLVFRPLDLGIVGTLPTTRGKQGADNPMRNGVDIALYFAQRDRYNDHGCKCSTVPTTPVIDKVPHSHVKYKQDIT